MHVAAEGGRVLALLVGLMTMQPVPAHPATPAAASVRELHDMIARGRLADAEAGASRLLADMRPLNRADSIVVLNATSVLVEARLRLMRFADPSMPLLVETLLSLSRALYERGALAIARAHQYAGYLARGRKDPRGELEQFRTALELIETADASHPSELAIALGNLAGAYYQAGRDSSARGLLERALRVLEENYPAEYPGVGPTLLNLNDAKIALGDTVGVTTAYERSLRIFEKHEGRDGPQVADALHRLGMWRLRCGDPRAAAASLERAAAILQVRDPDGSRFAATLLARARVHLALVEADSAISRSIRGARISRAVHGPRSPEYAAALVVVGDALRRGFRHDEAMENYVRALDILKGAPPADPRVLADCLQALASHSLELGRPSDAAGYAERALEVRTRLGGTRHRDTAIARLSYATALRSTQRPDSAWAQCAAAMTTLQAVSGDRDPVLGEAYLCRAAVERERGDLPRARADIEHALELIEKALGPRDPRLAECLHELGIVQRRLGDVPAAQASLQRALGIASIRQRDGAEVAGILGSLAILERARGDLPAATAHFREALGILGRILPPDHPQAALVLRNLASLENHSGRFGQAEALYRRALDILQKTLGPHPDVAATHLGLGNALKELGRSEEAREQYLAAIDIHRETLGSKAPGLALDYYNLAALMLELGETAAAMRMASDAERLGQQHFRLIAQGASEREALQFGAGRLSGTDIVLTASARSDSASDWERAWDLLIQSRAVVLEEIAIRRRFLSLHRDSALGELAGRLAAASNELAYLAVRGRGVESAEAHANRIAAARLEKEAAERNLASRSREFAAGQTLHAAGHQQVLDALPPRSAMIAWVRFHRLERVVRAGAHERAPPPEGEAYYAAFVAHGPRRPIRFVPLASAAEIDGLVREWHRQAGTGVATRGLVAAERAYFAAGERLRRAVWDPVATGLDTIKQVFLVPDGALALVSFDALPHDSGSFLVERVPLIRILSSERDLIRDEMRGRAGAGLLTLAHPDYDFAPTSSPPGPGGARRGIQCGQFRSLWFDPLPGTHAEMLSVVRLWRELASDAQSHRGRAPSHDLAGPAATEKEFKRLATGREVLHLATHGFFLGAGCAGARPSGGASTRDELSVEGLVAESPLLLSGLALAGANRRERATSSDDDGILTAEEITTLDLSGVDLVVLSACETGLGKVEAGEGVFGLRRAFQVAGARNLVMTLWSVDDAATAAWMAAMFEHRLRDGLGVAESVRAASIEVLAKRRAEKQTVHPYFWGAFVSTGGLR